MITPEPAKPMPLAWAPIADHRSCEYFGANTPNGVLLTTLNQHNQINPSTTFIPDVQMVPHGNGFGLVSIDAEAHHQHLVKLAASNSVATMIILWEQTSRNPDILVAVRQILPRNAISESVREPLIRFFKSAQVVDEFLAAAFPEDPTDELPGLAQE